MTPVDRAIGVVYHQPEMFTGHSVSRAPAFLAGFLCVTGLTWIEDLKLRTYRPAMTLRKS